MEPKAKMGVSITVIDKPMDDHEEPKSHEGVIKDEKAVKAIDILKEEGVSDDVIEKVEKALGGDSPEEKAAEAEKVEEEKKEEEGDGVGPNGELPEAEFELPR